MTADKRAKDSSAVGCSQDSQLDNSSSSCNLAIATNRPMDTSASNMASAPEAVASVLPSVNHNMHKMWRLLHMMESPHTNPESAPDNENSNMSTNSSCNGSERIQEVKHVHSIIHETNAAAVVPMQGEVQGHPSINGSNKKPRMESRVVPPDHCCICGEEAYGFMVSLHPKYLIIHIEICACV